MQPKKFVRQCGRLGYNLVKPKIIKIPTTKNPCDQCCISGYSDKCEPHLDLCRFMKDGITYYLKFDLPDGFKPIKSVPKDCTHFIGFDIRGNIHSDVHYASDLSGEEQPPFEGFFDKKYVQIISELIGWKPKDV